MRSNLFAVRSLSLVFVFSLLAALSECTLNRDKMIRLPVRWCVIEGANYAEGKNPGQLASADPFLSTLNYVNRIWGVTAGIWFIPAHSDGIPVISDPATRYGVKGDIEDGLPEARDVAQDCNTIWKKLYPDEEGIIMVAASRVLARGNASNTKGITPSVPPALWVSSVMPWTGERGDDLCGHPRNLTAQDVASTMWTVVQGASINSPTDRVVAHELGHVLMLGHGNGLDDNHDGLEPPQDGPRRFDDYCDPLWLLHDDPSDGYYFAEDELATAPAPNLMGRTASSTTLQPLQVEMARAVAYHIPGAIFLKPRPIFSVTFISKITPTP